MPTETTLTSSTVLLFGLYTFITIVGLIITTMMGRLNTSTMGEKVKNEAVTTVTSNFASLLEDARTARTELSIEREKRAELKGEVIGLTRQIDKLTVDMETIRTRLLQVEREKRELQEEKETLEKTIDGQSVEYQKLMVSIQARIDEAVQAVRGDYESRINELTEQINQRDNEINQLKQLLKEKSHVQVQSNPNPVSAVSTIPIPDPQPPITDGTGINARSDSTSPTIGEPDPTSPNNADSNPSL